MTRPTRPRVEPGLPRSARDRLARFESTTTRPSLLTVPAAFGMRASGFETVGDVMGCVAFRTAFEYLGRCGTTSSVSTPKVTLASLSTSPATSLLAQLARAYRTALDRMRTEAKALGADGVIGIRLQIEHHEDLREVVALGTAVRSTGRVRPGRIFTTDLPGADVSKLLFAGWAPVELHVAVQLGLRHVDQQTIWESSPVTRRSGQNVEVSGYTDLRQRIGQAVTSQLRTQIARSGADGALLSDLRVSSWHRHCMSMSSRSDLAALATATGTAIARFPAASAAGPRPLVVLPLGSSR